MIRNVVVHLFNEQPILADLLIAPKPIDVSVICSNVRTMSGIKPVFVERSDSTFVFPLAGIRFMELRADAMTEHDADGKAELAAETLAGAAASLAPDEDAFALPLGRLAWATGEDGATEPPVTPGALNGPLGLEPGMANAAAELSDEIDPDLLRRVRDA